MNKYRLFAWMILLASLAGFINTVSVFSFGGTTVSHITGLLSKFSISVSTGEIGDGLSVFFVILSFFVGAVVAGIATGERAFYLHRIYGWIILAVGVLMLIPLFLAPEYSVMLLAFLMGVQNGMVVSFRGILVRMTHMTGNLTDFGVFVGYKIRGNREEKPISGVVPASAIAGFTVGGILGILFYSLLGIYVFALASGVYLLLGFVYFHFQKTCSDKDFNGIADDQESECFCDLTDGKN